jgi:adenylate cyclase
LGDVAGGRQHIEIALGLNPRDFGTLYNAACFHALAGEPDRALDLLDQFVTAGHGYPDWLEHDPDLETLRELPRFREIMVRIEKPRR